MGTGHLITVRTPTSAGVFVTIGYFVAEENADQAINIIKNKIAKPGDEVAAVSYVSEDLLKALGVAPGEFRRTDARSPSRENNGPQAGAQSSSPAQPSLRAPSDHPKPVT
jgi:hypothetical protein